MAEGQHEHKHEPLRHDELQGAIWHEYDGIEEADNNLPTWWLWTFFGAIAFSLAYWFYYHGMEMAPVPSVAYLEEKAAAAAAAGLDLNDEQVSALVADANLRRDGQQAFKSNCAVCHGDNAEGKIGPNLTDPFWIHGGAPSAVFAVIRNGVPAKGMPQWGTVLGVRGTQAVAAYVLSLRDTNVPGGKEPQGDRWVPGAGAPSEGASPDTDGSGGGEAAPALEHGAGPGGTDEGASRGASAGAGAA
jgi:cytochrome c oxidase cbb3-type subunit 3